MPDLTWTREVLWALAAELNVRIPAMATKRIASGEIRLRMWFMSVQTPAGQGSPRGKLPRPPGNSPARSPVYAFMELLGRDRQLASAARAIGDVRRGSGRVLGLLGEAGLGKSALLAEIGERARAAGLRVVAGRGVEHERDIPFGVMCDALGELAGTPGAVPVAERFRRHREVAASIERLAPVALLLDDLHWADEASIELVLHLLRRPVPVPCCS